MERIDKKFVIVSCAVALAVIAAAPVIGFSVPKSESAIESSLVSLRKRDAKYISARDTKNDLEAEKEKLEKEISEKSSQLEEFYKSQDNLNKITESNASLEAERDKLKSDIEQKKSRLASLEASLGSYADKAASWTSGDYTVGEDIAAGKYKISGSGSIAVGKSGKAITNKPLKEEGESFTLNSGYRIHIDGNATLTPQ